MFVLKGRRCHFLCEKDLGADEANVKSTAVVGYPNFTMPQSTHKKGESKEDRSKIIS